MAVATMRPKTTIDSSLNISSTFHNTGIRAGIFHNGDDESHVGNTDKLGIASLLLVGIRLVTVRRTATPAAVDEVGDWMETAGAIRSSTNRVRIHANIPGRRRCGDVPPPMITER